MKNNDFEGIVRLRWHGDTSEVTDQLEAKVVKDIANSLKGLPNPSDLVFHTVFVGKTVNDEIVSVWGEIDDNDYFHCKYHKHPDWVSLKDLELEEAEDDGDFK